MIFIRCDRDANSSLCISWRCVVSSPKITRWREDEKKSHLCSPFTCFQEQQIRQSERQQLPSHLTKLTRKKEKPQKFNLEQNTAEKEERRRDCSPKKKKSINCMSFMQSLFALLCIIRGRDHILVFAVKQQHSSSSKKTTTTTASEQRIEFMLQIIMHCVRATEWSSVKRFAYTFSRPFTRV